MLLFYSIMLYETNDSKITWIYLTDKYTHIVHCFSTETIHPPLTLSVGVAQTLDAPGPLVEGGEARAQVGGVAGVGRHLRQATRDLTQGFGPTGRGVRHHGHVVAHVTEVLG